MQATYRGSRPWPGQRIAAAVQARSTAIVAGLSIVLIYALMPVPLYLSAAGGLGVSDALVQSGFFTVFASAGVVSIVLSVWTRQPLGFGWSAPALIYMVAAAQTHTPGEIAGGCLLAGAMMLAMSAGGWADRIARLAPMPVVMGVFAGSSMVYITSAAAAAGAEPWVAGAPIAGYFVARGMGAAWLPPVAGAICVGLGALAIQGQLEPVSLALETPPFDFVAPRFSVGALSMAIPLVVLSHGVGNLQAYSLLERAGYEPPRRLIVGLTGLVSMLHAVVAAPPAGMQKAALAIMTGDDAGPKEGRWLATVVASAGAILIAFCATSIAAFVAGLPAAFVVALMGVVLFPVVADAIRVSFTREAGIAGAGAFFVAASDFELWGIGAAFWGLVAGVALLRSMRDTG